MKTCAKRLCFGVFGKILFHCCLPKVTQKKLYNEMTMIIDPTCINSSDYHISRCFGCTQNVDYGVIEKARIANQEDVCRGFNEHIVPLLNEEKKKLFVLALLDVINEDNELDNTMRESFEKYFDATKDTLLKKGKFVFHKFLARAFIFTVVTVDNRVGKDSIKQISNDYINSFIKDKDTIQLSDEYEIQNIKSMAIESMDKGTLPVFSASEQILETFNKAIHAYNIIDFVNSDPMISLQANLLFGAIDFVEDINLKVVRKFFENQDEKTYKNVKAFAETLKSYNSCLGHHMEPHQGDINTFIPFYRGTHFKPEQGVDYEPNVTFENEVLNYRRALDSIYSKLFDGKSLII